MKTIQAQAEQCWDEARCGLMSIGGLSQLRTLIDRLGRLTGEMEYLRPHASILAGLYKANGCWLLLRDAERAAVRFAFAEIAAHVPSLRGDAKDEAIAHTIHDWREVSRGPLLAEELDDYLRGD